MRKMESKIEKLYYLLKTASSQLHFTNIRRRPINFQNVHDLSYKEWIILYPEEQYILSQLINDFEIGLEYSENYPEIIEGFN